MFGNLTTKQNFDCCSQLITTMKRSDGAYKITCALRNFQQPIVLEDANCLDISFQLYVYCYVTFIIIAVPAHATYVLAEMIQDV